MPFFQMKLSRDISWTRNESSKCGDELGKVVEKVCLCVCVCEREREKERDVCVFQRVS